mgnify:CR=1 FL=1
MVEALTAFLLSVTESMGYFGIYLYMVMVGTFVPVPSELVLVPAGYTVMEDFRRRLSGRGRAEALEPLPAPSERKGA